MEISSELLGTIARGYCSPENEKKVLDPVLCQAIAKEVHDSIFSSEEYKKVQQSLLCLNLELPASIVNDVKSKVNAVFAKL